MLGTIALPNLLSLLFTGGPLSCEPFSKSSLWSVLLLLPGSKSSFLRHYFLGGSFPMTAAVEILGAAKKGRRVGNVKEKPREKKKKKGKKKEEKKGERERKRQ